MWKMGEGRAGESNGGKMRTTVTKQLLSKKKELTSLKCLYYPKQSTESMQFLSGYQ